jgi:hypothetical protein
MFPQDIFIAIIVVVFVIILIFLYFQQRPNDLIKKIKEAVTKLVNSEVSLITYSEAIQYFVDQRQNHPELFAKGAMLLEKTSPGYIFTQVFLNEKNELVCHPDGRPFGRKLTVNQPDDELLQAFGQKLLVIVE